MKRHLFHHVSVAIATLFAIIFLPAAVQAQTPIEAYAVMNTEAKTFTFYYDANKDLHTEGTIYPLPDSGAGYPEWTLVYDRKTITTVTFDNSMVNCHPASTRLWFDGFEKLTTINNIENLNTDQVTNMGGMFSGCKVLTSLDVSGFKTGKVTYMDYMFDRCEILPTLDVSGFDTKAVTNMSFMFYGCKALTSLDVSSFDTKAVTDMSDMFHNCEALTTIYCNDTWTCEMSISMFENCTQLKGGTNGSVAYDASKIDITMANPTTGYFTGKGATAIKMPTADIKRAYKGIYTLKGTRPGDDLNRLPAGIYIVNGKKVMKR
ncbi:BspA family leucine-rich repeat surface protein [Alloprevotella tannerae]|uniref:DUF285 domain-containing protein n=1 Tax=Alloprevotella tannerae TaxID=76122 RepID=UPI001EDC225B|nr:DUF285 domain-containing protein [Alloprevotella tannerae]MCG2649070.1 BspA family leucine-rich repeat surface protein [Alloprevotella tannerae]MCG2652046.1 BspA family leucine-rich repeat surface protein [Alloprevotella tannerae]